MRIRRLLLTLGASVIMGQMARSAVVNVETVPAGNKLSLAQIEVTSGAGSGLPNRVLAFETLLPTQLTNYLSVPEGNSSNTISVLGTSDALAPEGGDRLLLLGDPYLNTGIFNPSANNVGVRVAFSQPVINGPGEDLVVFELSIGNGQTPDPFIIRQPGGAGESRNVQSGFYQLQGNIPAELKPNTFLATVENGGTLDFAELTTVLLANNSNVTNPKWHAVPIDLTVLGVASWDSIDELEILSSDASRAVDLLMVAGFTPVVGPGDFNVDQVVDGHDFLLWQRQYGSIGNPYAGADASGDGLVGATDLMFWQAHYGTSTNEGANVVPEPNAHRLVLALLANGLLLLRRATPGGDQRWGGPQRVIGEG